MRDARGRVLRIPRRCRQLVILTFLEQHWHNVRGGVGAATFINVVLLPPACARTYLHVLLAL